MNRTLNDILEDAKNCPVKGRLYIYEQFKHQIQDLNLTPYEFTVACRKLAKCLEI